MINLSTSSNYVRPHFQVLDNRLYEVTTGEGSTLVIGRDYSELVNLMKARNPKFVAQLYAQEIKSFRGQGFKDTFGVPLAQDHADFIIGAYANRHRKEAKQALQPFKEGRWFWTENGLFYFVDKDGFDGVVVADMPALNRDGVQLPNDYTIDDILKAEMVEVSKSSQGRVLVPKGFNDIRIVEGYNFGTKYQNLADFEKNPFVIAVFNGPQRAEGVARFVVDKEYFKRPPYIWASENYNTVKSNGGQIKRTLSMSGFGNKGEFIVYADGSHKDKFRVRGKRLQHTKL